MAVALRMLAGGLVLGIAGAAMAQSATDGALAIRRGALGQATSAAGVLARQVGMSGDNDAVSTRKAMEAAVSSIASQQVAIERLVLPGDLATSARVCPQTDAVRAGNRAAGDAVALGRGLADQDARTVWIGGDDRTVVPEERSAGGMADSVVTVGMPLPGVPAISNSAASEGARVGALRRAASVQTARAVFEAIEQMEP